MCDYNEFYAEKLVVARKPHKCCETGRIIQPGEKYWSIAGKWDGAFATFAQSEAAYHFARFLNGIGPTTPWGNDDCIELGGVRDFVAESGNPEYKAEWERVCAGEVTRDTTTARAKVVARG